MYFSQRLKVVEEYRKWIEEIKEEKGISLKDCYETFLAFLETKGYLKDEWAREEEGRGSEKQFSRIKIDGKWRYGFTMGEGTETPQGKAHLFKWDDGKNVDLIIENETFSKTSGIWALNGPQIFAGDIVLWEHEANMSVLLSRCLVVYDEVGGYFLQYGEKYVPIQCSSYHPVRKDIRVIGNKWDNPELLEEMK